MHVCIHIIVITPFLKRYLLGRHLISVGNSFQANIPV